MAQKHKAATQVQIARTEEESAFQSFVERWWKPGLLLFVLGSGFVLYSNWQSGKEAEQVNADWGRLASEVTFGSFGGEVTPTSPAALASVASEWQSKPLGGWAKALEAKALLDEGDTQGAITALQELERQWPDHPAASLQLPVREEGTSALSEFVSERVAALDRWKEQHANLFANPALPEGSPRVTLKTSRGDLTVGLFQEQAPRHVENFLKHCNEGYYDNTKFHRVIASFMVQGGDPNTKEGDPTTWGTGGPGYKLDPEPNDLRHFQHVLAAAKMPGDTESSGSQFYITTEAAHHLDGQHTVFGVLLEGESVLTDIASSPVEGDKPVDPVVLESTQVL